MSVIAVQLEKDKSILNTYLKPESGVIRQGKEPGWEVVNNVSGFLDAEKHLWTVRQSDNTLVHISTNKTPEEEKNSVIAQLTLQNLALSNDIADLKKLSTAQTLQSLQDAKDKSDQNEVITGLTKEILELKQNTTTETK
ncbi:MAG TPA: hypothetical protein DEQ50_08320 [Lactobacillus sp.]|nr:hypothetical protein [Lactobacillus sp.]